MKNTKFVIIIVVCVCVILGGYYYLTNRNNAKEEENITLTEIQELTTKNLDKNFPATPREVVKLYNRIITCFYNDEYTDDELYDLGDQARKLFDDELLENNPRDEYFKNLKEDISEYHDKNKTIASSAVDSSNDVEYKEVLRLCESFLFYKRGKRIQQDLSNVCFEKGCRWKLEDSGVLSGEW